MSLKSLFRFRPIVVIAVLFSAMCGGLPAETPVGRVDPLELKGIPEGIYELEQRGTATGDERIRLEVSGNRLRFLEASNERYQGLGGKAERIGNGVFLVRLSNRSLASTQFWAIGRDGAATVVEIPDRGEGNRAVPVKNASKEATAKP